MNRLKPIPDFPSYMAHSCGKIFSVKAKGIVEMSVQISNAGYPRVNLYKGGRAHGFSVHRLVAMAFYPNPDNLPQVNHKDRNKLNSAANNVEWVTPKQNAKHYQENK